jgi:ankyrin repeat protein
MINKKPETELQRKFRTQNLINEGNYSSEDFLKQNWRGRNCLHIAACFGGLEHIPSDCMTIENLLLRDNDGDTPLHLAAKSGNLEFIVQKRFPAYIFNIKARGGTAYEIAISSGYAEKIPEYILQEQPKYMHEAIISWAEHAQEKKLPEFLLNEEKWINNNYHHTVARLGKLLFLQDFLLSEKALIDNYSQGETPLSLAIRSGHFDVQYFDKICVNRWRQDIIPGNNYTYMHLIAESGLINLIPDNMLTADNLMCEDHRGRTPISCAIQYSSFLCVMPKIVNEINWDTPLKIKPNTTYYHLLARYNCLQFLPRYRLVNKKLMTKDDDENTPLSLLILDGRLPEIIQLLNESLNWSQRIASNCNKTHYHIAAEIGHIGFINNISDDDYFLTYETKKDNYICHEISLLDVIWDNNQFDFVPPHIRWKYSKYYEAESKKLILNNQINFLPLDFDWVKIYEDYDNPMCYAARNGKLHLLDKSLLNKINLNAKSAIRYMNAADIACHLGCEDVIPRELRYLATNYIESCIEKGIMNGDLRDLPDWLLKYECIKCYLHEIAHTGLYSHLPSEFYKSHILKTKSDNLTSKFSPGLNILHKIIGGLQGNSVDEKLFFDTSILEEKDCFEETVYNKAARSPDLGGFPAALFTRDVLNTELSKTQCECVNSWMSDAQSIKHGYLCTEDLIADVIFISDNAKHIPHHLMMCSRIYRIHNYIEKLSDNGIIFERQLESHGLNYRISSPVVGMRYENRMEVAKNLSMGDYIQLKREVYNQFDSNAIAVFDKQNKMLGYLPRELSLILSEEFDEYSDGTYGEVENVMTLNYNPERLSITITFDLNFSKIVKNCKNISSANDHENNIIMPGALLADSEGRFFITKLINGDSFQVIYENGIEKTYKYYYLKKLLEDYSNPKILHIKDINYIFEYFNIREQNSVFDNYDYIFKLGIIRNLSSQIKIIKNTTEIRANLMQIRKKLREPLNIDFLEKSTCPEKLHTFDHVANAAINLNKYVRLRRMIIFGGPALLVFLTLSFVGIKNGKGFLFSISISVLTSFLFFCFYSIIFCILLRYIHKLYDFVFCTSEMYKNKKILLEKINNESSIDLFLKSKATELENLVSESVSDERIYCRDLRKYLIMRCVSPWDYKSSNFKIITKYLERKFVQPENFNQWQKCVWDSVLHGESVKMNDYCFDDSITLNTLIGLNISQLVQEV